MNLLLSQTRRGCFLLKPPPPSPSHLVTRWLSSDPKPDPKPFPDLLPPDPRLARLRPHPVEIELVSYAPKPKDQSPPPEPETTAQQSGQQQQDPLQSESHVPRRPREFSPQNWTRDDARFMKDTLVITPVSYQARVAPLPEDRVVSEGEGDDKGNGEVAEEAVRMERRRVMKVAVQEEERAVVPFPRLIMPENREKRAPLDLMDAIRQVKANARNTFDETIEAHVRLGIEKSRSDMIVRGTLTLPHGGKKVLSVAVFAEGADAEEARSAGADFVGGTELIDEIASAGKIDFDKCFTTPQLYPRVAKLARILNRHGLMPDAKQGTVIRDVSRAVKDAKKNQIKFRMDKTSIVHAGLGKVSFTEEALCENVGAFMNAILQAKPAGLKKTSKYAGYITSFHICSTMGQGFPISVQSLSKAVDHYNKVHLREG